MQGRASTARASCSDTRPAMRARAGGETRVGSTIAGFTLDRRVSATLFATVYHAVRGATQAAIKVHHVGGDGELEERALREREQQRQLAHPCIARTLAWGRLDDGSPYLASEWVDGVSLEERLGRGPLEWPEARRLMGALARGVGAIHAAGVVHRDLKPSNILVPASGEPAAVVVDLGHALVLGETRLTDRGVILGSASYMAPEQAAGRPLDGRADLYALGVVLYRVLTGELPFAHPSPAEVLRCHQFAPPQPPRQRAPRLGISADAEDLCLWLLAKDPARRVPNARVLWLVLAGLGASAPASTPSPATTTAPAGPSAISAEERRP